MTSVRLARKIGFDRAVALKQIKQGAQCLSARACKVGIGGYDPKVIAGLKAAGKPVPVNHSPLFAPDAEGAIRTATQAIVLSIVGGVRPSAKP